MVNMRLKKYISGMSARVPDITRQEGLTIRESTVYEVIREHYSTTTVRVRAQILKGLARVRKQQIKDGILDESYPIPGEWLFEKDEEEVSDEQATD